MIHIQNEYTVTERTGNPPRRVNVYNKSRQMVGSLDVVDEGVNRLIQSAPLAIEALLALGVGGDGYCWCFNPGGLNAGPHTGECHQAALALQMYSGVPWHSKPKPPTEVTESPTESPTEATDVVSRALAQQTTLLDARVTYDIALRALAQMIAEMNSTQVEEYVWESYNGERTPVGEALLNIADQEVEVRPACDQCRDTGFLCERDHIRQAHVAVGCERCPCGRACPDASFEEDTGVICSHPEHGYSGRVPV